jgi:CRISPR/Cas system-associated exonuclease Cas4 (RecB family)
MDEQALEYASNRVLTASEIGSYIYCNRSWWLDKVGGYEPTNAEELQMGTWLHEEHGQEVRRAGRMNRVAVALIAGAALLALVWIILQVVA